MLKYAPQYMITKDIAAAYVIARRGLGIEEKIPENYLTILSKLSVEELKELKKHIKKTVKNRHLKGKHIRDINKAIKTLQSFGSESERGRGPLDGTSPAYRDLWQVLKVAVVTLFSPEKVLRDFSILKGVLINRG